MAIGVDIKEVFEEIGTAFSIKGNGSGEYLRLFENRQATKPFIREFFIQADLPYDTDAETGDILILTAQGTPFLLMNKTGVELENEIFKYNCVLYKANVSGEIYRPSGEVRNPQTYKIQPVFNLLSSGEHSLLTEAPFTGADLEETEYGRFSTKRKSLFIPESSGIQVDDRFQASSGEFYKVVTTSNRMFGGGIYFCELEEDTR